MKKTLWILTLIVGLGLAGLIVVKFYPYIFAREVHGMITGVTKVNPQTTVIGSGSSLTNEQLFSFAVAIKDSKTGEIVTGSSEDRQWAVAKEGLCAEAKFFPYPPWQLSNADTYFNVRLMKLYECNAAPTAGSVPVGATPQATPPATVPQNALPPAQVPTRAAPSGSAPTATTH